MGRVERADDGHEEGDDFLDGEVLLFLLPFAEEVSEVYAFHQLHDDAGSAVVCSDDTEDSDGGESFEGGHDAGFAYEANAVVPIVCQMVGEELDGDVP